MEPSVSLCVYLSYHFFKRRLWRINDLIVLLLLEDEGEEDIQVKIIETK